MTDLKEAFKMQIAAKIAAKATVAEWCKAYEASAAQFFAAVKDFASGAGVNVQEANNGATALYENRIQLRSLTIQFEGAAFSMHMMANSGGPDPLNSHFYIAVTGTKMPAPFSNLRQIAFDPDTKSWVLAQSLVNRPEGGSKHAGQPISIEDVQRAIIAIFA